MSQLDVTSDVNRKISLTPGEAVAHGRGVVYMSAATTEVIDAIRVVADGDLVARQLATRNGFRVAISGSTSINRDGSTMVPQSS
jgi:hypothetical protein